MFILVQLKMKRKKLRNYIILFLFYLLNYKMHAPVKYYITFYSSLLDPLMFSSKYLSALNALVTPSGLPSDCVIYHP